MGLHLKPKGHKRVNDSSVLLVYKLEST